MTRPDHHLIGQLAGPVGLSQSDQRTRRKGTDRGKEAGAETHPLRLRGEGVEVLNRALEFSPLEAQVPPIISRKPNKGLGGAGPSAIPVACSSASAASSSSRSISTSMSQRTFGVSGGGG